MTAPLASSRSPVGTSPAPASSRSPMTLSSVLLPEPDCPTTATSSPPFTARSTPRRTRTAPPEGARYDFTSPVARSMASLRAPPDRLDRREADDAEGGPRGRGRAQQDREGERPRDEARREVEELLARA